MNALLASLPVTSQVLNVSRHSLACGDFRLNAPFCHKLEPKEKTRQREPAGQLLHELASMSGASNHRKDCFASSPLAAASCNPHFRSWGALFLHECEKKSHPASRGWTVIDGS